MISRNVKVFAVPTTWIEGELELETAARSMERITVEESRKFFLNPRLSRPAWVEKQHDGVERICVEIAHDGQLSQN